MRIRSKIRHRQSRASTRGPGRAGRPVGEDCEDETARLRAILEGSPVATIAVDAQGHLIHATAGAASLFVDPKGVGQSPLADVPRCFNEPHFGRSLRAVLQGGRVPPREVQAQDGRWFLREIAAFAGADGGAVISFAEISAIKRAEQGNKLARAYLDSILGTICQPLVVLDPYGCVISASRSFYQLFDTTAAALAGRRLTSALRCLDVPAFRGFLEMIEQEGATIEDCEIDIAVASLGPRTFVMSARVLREEAGAERKTLIALVDMTQARSEGDRMQAAQLEAEMANQGKSRFLAAASHDLRQPLQTISLIQGLLEKRAADEPTRGLVRRLEESVSTMSSMLDKLLDINQLETGTVRPCVQTFRLTALLEDLRSEFLFHTATRQLDWRVVASSLAVQSDPRLLEQVLRNLLSNAAKYTERGKILLGCRRRGGRVRIEIWDTGVGIPEAEFSAIFNEFHQLGNPARQRARGLGLGLSIVHRLAGLMGHPISVRSVVGVGSVFTIELPLGQVTAVAPPLQETAPRPAPSGGGLVLIVEDDPDLREMLQSLFDCEGFTTMSQSEGALALAMLDAAGAVPDLIVADYNLPGGMSGIDLISRLQAGRLRPPRAVLLTGDVSTKSLRAIADHDCIHLNKPVLATRLLDLSRALLAAEAGPADGTEAMAPAARTPSVAGLQPGGSSTPPSTTSHARPVIAIVDDDTRLRDSVREVLVDAGYEASVFDSGEAFLANASMHETACLIIDAMLPGLSGVEIIAQLRRDGCAIPAIVITGHGAVPMAVAAMQAGAVDFIEKPVSGPALVASIARALNFAAAPTAAKAVAAHKLAALTVRQREIMRHILAGHPNKNIAADLAISQRTVENHRAAIMRKTGSASLADLVRTALTSTGP